MSTKEMKIKRFVDLVSSILERPGMYSVNNVEDLNLFILGYKMATSEEGYVTSLMSSFRDYLNDNFKTNEDVDWARLIRYHAGGDYNSLKLFLKYFFAFTSKEENFSPRSP